MFAKVSVPGRTDVNIQHLVCGVLVTGLFFPLFLLIIIYLFIVYCN